MPAAGRVRRRRARTLLCACVLAFGVACRRGAPAPTAPAAPLPPVSGTLTVDGLSAPVAVVRDRWGIPHIDAASQDDLFFAQGFVAAEDRLFQMDLWRRSVQGRLSEVLGANFIERDVMTRRVQYRGDVDADWASYGPDARAIAGAFVRGVNAWVTMARARLPEEFVLAGWRPDFWTPEDLLNRTDAFVAADNATTEVLRARLVCGGRRAPRRYVVADGRSRSDDDPVRARPRHNQPRRGRRRAPGRHGAVLSRAGGGRRAAAATRRQQCVGDLARAIGDRRARSSPTIRTRVSIIHHGAISCISTHPDGT